MAHCICAKEEMTNSACRDREAAERRGHWNLLKEKSLKGRGAQGSFQGQEQHAISGVLECAADGGTCRGRRPVERGERESYFLTVLGRDKGEKMLVDQQMKKENH